MKQYLKNAVDQMPGALTILDTKGDILFYNQFAATMVDRKPEYIHTDIRDYHKVKSNEKIDKILDEYANGSRQVHSWQLKRDGKVLQVRVAPLYVDDAYQGLTHLVMPIVEHE